MALDLLFLLFLTLSAATIGEVWLRLLGWDDETWSDRAGLSLPLGLGTMALAALALGQLGWLRGDVLMLCGVLTLLPAIWFLRARSLVQIKLPGIPQDKGALAWDALLGAGLVGTLLTALLPVTDGDALCYHLQVPKIFLGQGSVSYDPDLHETVYPLTVEMLFAIALALRGPVACRLVAWLLGIVFALNVAALARPWLRARARWAATIALLAPAISNGMGAPLNDVALAAFANAALVAWLRWWRAPSSSSALAAGGLMGFAIGVKFPALVLLGVLGLPTLVRSIRAGRSRDALIFGLGALVVGGAWYLRASLYTGNPVHPFFRNVFGGAGLDEVLDPIKRPLTVNLFNLLTALVPITLDPARFDSFSHQFGPVYLLFLPLLFVEKPPRRLVGLVLIGFGFLTLCLTQRQSMRFVLIALGPFSVGVAWLAARWWTRPNLAARGLIVLLGLCLAFEAALAVARPRVGVNVLLGRESAEAYLTRREPTYPVGKWIDKHLPGDSRLIGQDHRGFYLPRPYAMELAHRRRTGLGSSGENAGAIVRQMSAEGFTHLLLCPPVPEDAVEFDPTLGRLLQPWLQAQTPLYRQDLTDADGVVRRYAIYALDERIASQGAEVAR